ncbi:SRPBCC family protein [Georgenia sp. Z1491]|uniref:SRPBCC family protein n=1 Tax=Georgenia sp. Z1491 TaxID=3416707 RepID=UPI003CF4ED7D
MSAPKDESRVVTASAEVVAPASEIFELIAVPANQPRWDGNENLVASHRSEPLTEVGDVFEMLNTSGRTRANTVSEFEQDRLVAWMPGGVGEEPAGHVWRWELEEIGEGRTLVTHTYDWTQLHDESRHERARSTTSDNLLASIERLKALAES